MAVDLTFPFLLTLGLSIVHARLVFSHRTSSLAQSRLVYSENNLVNIKTNKNFEYQTRVNDLLVFSP